MNNIKAETIKGIKWNTISKFTLQPVQFIYGAILAHLVTPHEMGILGLTAIFFAVAELLKDAGFGAALIRKQDRTEEDCSTVFWFNIGASFVLSFILFLVAPWFASFYNEPALTNLTRVSAVLMVLNSTTNVHWCLYSARRDFKTPAIVGMITTLTAMPFCLWAAYAGWSYWAPFLHGIISSLLSLVIMWIISPWKPKCIFSLKSFREFLGYGSKLVASGLITTMYGESRTFIIGKFYSSSQLAIFSRAKNLSYFVPHFIDNILSGVSFPVLSTLQEDVNKLHAVYIKFVRLTALATLWPILLLAANSDAFIYCVYGENWLPVADFIEIICCAVFLDRITYVAVHILLVMGRTDLNLKRTIWLYSASLISMIVGACYSIEGICYAMIFSCAFNAWITMFFVNKCTGISQLEQLRCMLPYAMIALVSVLPCMLLNLLSINSFLLLSLSLLSSTVCFLSILYIKKDDIAMELFSSVKETKIGKLIFHSD